MLKKRNDFRLKKWLLFNLKVGALSFGASNRILFYHEQVVEQWKWLKNEEFQESLTITSVMPGPNLVNLVAYLGFQLTNAWGAVSGLFWLALPGALIAVGIWEVVPFDNRHVAAFFTGLSLGSIMMFSLFMYRLMRGTLTTYTQLRLQTEKKDQGFKISRLKLVARWALAAAVFVLSFQGYSLVYIILIGAVIAFAVEFGLSDGQELSGADRGPT